MPNAAFVTLLTDLADYPPNFWIVPESEFIICGSAARQSSRRWRWGMTSGGFIRPPG